MLYSIQCTKGIIGPPYKGTLQLLALAADPPSAVHSLVNVGGPWIGANTRLAIHSPELPPQTPTLQRYMGPWRPILGCTIHSLDHQVLIELLVKQP